MDKENFLFLRELLKTILYVSLIVIVVRFFVIQPFVVKGKSMEPNFHDNEYLFVDEISYDVSAPKRGDVVVFKHPEPTCTAFVNLNFINRIFRQGPCTNYIKRIIGLPGETVKIQNGTVTIKNTKDPSGFVLNETYVPSDTKLLGDMEVKVEKDKYFVLGDNRQPNASSDSREWGTLPKNHITGKAWLRVLPFNEFGFTPHPKY